jgi:UTP--glucose-1-phosphate uridylyltransferase
MLPVVAKPVIQYVVQACAASGIEQVILVTGAGKKPLEDYFDTAYELEQVLARTGKTALLEEVRRTRELAEIVYVRQHEPRGNGDAVLCARSVVGDEPFVMLWGDDILLGEPPVPAQLIAVAERFEAPVVGVRAVSSEDISKYGVLEVNPIQPGLYRALSVIEKPKPEEAPSDLAQIGGFVLTPDIFQLLAETPIGPSGELYLADALVKLMGRRDVYAYEFQGRRYDAGDKVELIRANIELALDDPSLGPRVRAYIARLSEDLLAQA